MYWTRPVLYSLRFSWLQNNASSLHRKSSVDLETLSTVVLATAGLSMSIYCMLQMQKTPSQHRTHVVSNLRRLIYSDTNHKLRNDNERGQMTAPVPNY